MTVTTVREICRFCLALATVLLLWTVIRGVKAGGISALLTTRAHSGCSASLVAPDPMSRDRTNRHSR